METNKGFFYFVLLLILLLLIGLVYFHRPQSKTPRSVFPSKVSAQTPAESGPDSISVSPRKYDFSSLLDEPNEEVPSAKDVLSRPAQNPYARGRVLPPAAAPVAERPNSYFRYANTSRTSSHSVPPASASKGVTYNSGITTGGASYIPAAVPSATYAQAPGPTSAAAQEQRAQAIQDEREQIFSGFGVTAAEQKKMNRKLNGLSAWLERAIAQSLRPKSKREQAIEKYLNRGGAASSTAGGVADAAGGQGVQSAAQSITTQLAARSRQVINDMRATYGKKAAERAGKLMNDFQKEMMDVLNGPGSEQEKQIRANAVNNKYNKKLNKLNEDEATTKMQGDLSSRNSQMLASISKQFNSATADALRPVLDKYSQERMALIRTPGDETEKAKLMAEIDERERKDINDVLAKANPADPTAANRMVALQNEEAKTQILERQKAIEAGTVQDRAFFMKESTLEVKKNEWQKEGDRLVKSFEAYGSQAASEAKSLTDELRNYRTELRQRAIAEGLSEAEVERLDMEKTEEINKKLNNLAQSSAQGARDQFAAEQQDIMQRAEQQWQELQNSDATPEEKQAGFEKIQAQVARDLEDLTSKLPPALRPAAAQ